MSDGIKFSKDIQGLNDIHKLLTKQGESWFFPENIDLFLDLVRQVLRTSKYKGHFMEKKWLKSLREMLRIKAERVRVQPDLEEVIDVAAYAAMIFTILMQRLDPKEIQKIHKMRKEHIIRI